MEGALAESILGQHALFIPAFATTFLGVVYMTLRQHGIAKMSDHLRSRVEETFEAILFMIGLASQVLSLKPLFHDFTLAGKSCLTCFNSWSSSPCERNSTRCGRETKILTRRGPKHVDRAMTDDQTPLVNQVHSALWRANTRPFCGGAEGEHGSVMRSIHGSFL